MFFYSDIVTYEYKRKIVTNNQKRISTNEINNKMYFKMLKLEFKKIK